MPSRSQFRATLMILVAWTAAMALPRVWAARHATLDDGLSPVADAINAAV